MMVIDNVYAIGELVYLKTDPDQDQRLITGIIVRATSLIYELSLADRASNHYDFEIVKEENTLIKI